MARDKKAKPSTGPAHATGSGGIGKSTKKNQGGKPLAQTKPHPPRPNGERRPITEIPAAASAPSSSSSSSSSGTTSKLSALQQQFAKKLEGARFRTINEDLYTRPGASSFTDFQQHPEKFTIYHQGYREQAKGWPINPLDMIIDWLKNSHKKAVVADMGCGEARLAASVPNRVHSFDLVAATPSVTACDIAHVPLADQSVDIVVFCLSLMGTNLTDFIQEAHRILKVGGLLRVVEVRSRFQDNSGIKVFIRFLKGAGFNVKPDAHLRDNKMFFDVEAVKTNKEDPCFELALDVKSCLYKKR